MWCSFKCSVLNYHGIYLDVWTRNTQREDTGGAASRTQVERTNKDPRSRPRKHWQTSDGEPRLHATHQTNILSTTRQLKRLLGAFRIINLTAFVVRRLTKVFYIYMYMYIHLHFLVFIVWHRSTVIKQLDTVNECNTPVTWMTSNMHLFFRFW